MKSFIVMLAFAAATWVASDALAQTYSDEPASSPDATLNRREARSYNNLVDHDAAFRNQRMHRECDPIQSDDLRRQCIGSFGGATSSGSSAQPLRPTGGR